MSNSRIDPDTLADESGRKYSYWLREDGGDWRQVTVEEFVNAERSAGFVNTLGQPHRPATAGFGRSGSDGSISGTVVPDSVEEILEAATPGAFGDRWIYKGQQFVDAWHARDPGKVETR